MFLLVVAVIVALLVVLIALLVDRVRLPFPGVPLPPTTPPTAEPTQPASCPDVQVIAIPGTWESSAGDDPFNPTANPQSLLLKVTNPLAAEFSGDRAEIYTLPYPAEFRRPGGPPEMSYDESRAIGISEARDVMAARHAECPLTTYALIGFSQGAVIAGDIAAEIGNNNAPVPEDRMLGVALLADGRRDPDAAPTVGPAVAGVGLEVSLAGLPVIPGATLSGKRPGGFGELADRTVQLCAPNDLICDAPLLTDLVLAFNRVVNDYLNNPVHAFYDSFVVDDSGLTATQWTVNWARDLINEAPTPAHS
ncbi:cutinase [Hoyosella rhizosphaerae]|uniref:Cutinase n=1 Tax=Hoyosella rhizosphaerae TaxID=1755582 RepID=A0A916XCZ4_9ACTN|nr:cutinase [Hoyosella rhizosphaerae]